MSKIIRITESELINLVKKVIKEQSFKDQFFGIAAASGKQKCGKRVKWGGRGGDDCPKPEQGMSEKQNKKYNENIYNNEMLNSYQGEDYQKRLNSLTQTTDLNSVAGSIDTNKKFSLIYFITNKLNKNKEWFFNNWVRKELNLSQGSDITDNNILDFIKKKGGFDSFKKYYLENVMM